MRLTVLALVMAIAPQVRSAINRAFRSDEFEIVWTATPDEAVEASKRVSVSLMLLDLDGSARARPEVIEELRTVNPNLPIIVLADQSSVVGEPITHETVVLLRKPFAAALLADTVSVLLGVTDNGSPCPIGSVPEVNAAVTESKQFCEMLVARSKTPFDFTRPYCHFETDKAS
jgi:DNA-binding response OmpR family regulator